MTPRPPNADTSHPAPSDTGRDTSRGIDAEAPGAAASLDGFDHDVEIHLDEVLAVRGMTLTELANRAGITLVNLSVLKNGRARAIRFTTLTAICHVLDCQPGDLLTVRKHRR